MNLDSMQLVRQIEQLKKRIDDLARPEMGWTPHFLDEPYTNTDFDGDSFSSVGAHTKIENSDWSTTVPTDAKALIIRMIARDSGSAASTALYFSIYATSTATNPAAAVRPAGITNDAVAEIQGIVPCTDGDVWYRCSASGANTMDVWLTVVGYWT